MFDFSNPRVRYDGEVLTKYDLAWYLQSLSKVYFPWTIYYDVYSYKELAENLQSLIKTFNYEV